MRLLREVYLALYVLAVEKASMRINTNTVMLTVAIAGVVAGVLELEMGNYLAGYSCIIIANVWAVGTYVAMLIKK